MDRRAVTQIIFDVISAAILIMVDQGLQEVQPVRRGFWCSDETIKYPLQTETVGYKMLLQLTILAPIIVLLVSEILFYQVNNRCKIFLFDQEFWYSIITVLSSFAFIFEMNSLITSFVKYRVGRLRPVFLSVCQPNIDCSDPIWSDQYITNFTCSSGRTMESFVRTSFPSGHSSMSMVSWIFIVVYIWKRYRYDSLRYFIALPQLAALFIGLFIALSRVYDNIHHWSDVLAGSLLGTGIALIGALIPGRFDRLTSNRDNSEMASTKLGTV